MDSINSEVNQHLKQVKVAADDIKRACEEVIDHEDSWSTFKETLLEKIKRHDDFFRLIQR